MEIFPSKEGPAASRRDLLFTLEMSESKHENNKESTIGFGSLVKNRKIKVVIKLD